jgi:hypothetical protein
MKLSTVETDAAIGATAAPAKPFRIFQPLSASKNVRSIEYEVKFTVLRIDKDIRGGTMPLYRARKPSVSCNAKVQKSKMDRCQRLIC